MPCMKQLEKLDGFGNVQMVEVERPEPGPGQMLVQLKRSLISRGSELFYRYVREEAVPKKIMGYYVADNLNTESSLKALKMAVKNWKNKGLALIHHSDRGIPYCRKQYVTQLQKRNIKISMHAANHPNSALAVS